MAKGRKRTKERKFEESAVKILELREKTGLNQKEFAEVYHLSLRTLQQWEQGRSRPAEYLVWMMEKLYELKPSLFSKK